MSLLRTLRGELSALGCIALAACAIAVSQPRVAATEKRIKETSDLYLLPPPDELVRISLGYRAALADYLWADVLVRHGLIMLEKRRFESVAAYLDAITTLDPSFREPYRLTDTLVTFQIGETPQEDLREARRLMERGVKELPNDAELWLGLGQFVGFLAPSSYLKDEAEKQEWRRTGADYLARAAELAGNNPNVAWQAIAGASTLYRAGERAATIRFYERVMATTDDEELKQHVEPLLKRLIAEEAEKGADEKKELITEYRKRNAAFLFTRDAHMFELWQTTFSGLSRDRVRVLGPDVDPARCAGRSSLGGTDPACATSWRNWGDELKRRTDR